MEIFVLGYLLTFVGAIWAIIRLLQYQWGAYSDYIYMSPLASFALIAGIWIPVAGYAVLAYVLLWCKSVNTLVSIRKEMVSALTAEDVVDATEHLILTENLVSDEWVINTWSKTSRSEWINRLSANPSFLKQALEEHLQIHASKLVPYAAWTEIVKYYLYLDERR